MSSSTMDDALDGVAAQPGKTSSQETSRDHSALLEQLAELNRQVGSGLGGGDIATLVLETTQGIGRAIHARRVRIRFIPPGEERVT